MPTTDPNMLVAQLLQELSTHVTSAALICYLIQAAKTSNLPLLAWISDDTKRLNAWLSVAGAVAVGFGISATGNFDHGWTVVIPSGPALLGSVVDSLKQWVTNQFFYDRFVQTSGAAPALPPAKLG